MHQCLLPYLVSTEQLNLMQDYLRLVQTLKVKYTYFIGLKILVMFCSAHFKLSTTTPLFKYATKILKFALCLLLTKPGMRFTKMWLTCKLIKNLQQTLPSQRTVPPLRYITQAGVFVDEYHSSNWKEKNSIINAFGIIYMYGKKSSFLEICNFWMIRQGLSRTFVRLKEWNKVKFHKDSGKWGPKAGKFFQHPPPAH